MSHADAVVARQTGVVNLNECVLGPHCRAARGLSAATYVGADELRRIKNQGRHRRSRAVNLNRRAAHVALIVGANSELPSHEMGLSEVGGQ